jgi:hypothetical protein
MIEWARKIPRRMAPSFAAVENDAECAPPLKVSPRH